MPLRVLLIEDREDDELLVLRELQKAGYEVNVERVYSLQSITTALQSGRWDVILSDYHLPGFTALEVLARVQDLSLDIPVLVVSGAVGEEVAIEAMRRGAHDYIMKDNLNRLGPAVGRELAEMEHHRERRRAERALRVAEDRFRQLTENVGEVFWLVDCDTNRMTYVSPAFEKIWERPSQPLLEDAEALLQTVHPEDFGRIEASLRRNGWMGFNEEYRIERLDGSVRWVSTRSFPVEGAGSGMRSAGISSDVTERKALEAGMKKMSRALEQTADVVLITDRNGKIDFVNQAFEDVTGYTRDEVLGRSPGILRSGFHPERFYAQLWRSLQTGLPFSEVFINRRRNGDLYYEAKTITPVRGEGGEITHYVSTGKDITEQLRRRESLKQAVHYDPATGLANSALCRERLDYALPHARHLGRQVAIFYLGVDVAGLLGDGAVGTAQDRLLRGIAERLREVAGNAATVAAMGRGEFVVLQKFIGEAAEADAVASALVTAFTHPIVAEGYELHVAPAIGISLFPEHGEAAELLLDNARVAMLEARREREVPFMFFRRGMTGGERPRVNG